MTEVRGVGVGVRPAQRCKFKNIACPASRPPPSPAPLLCCCCFHSEEVKCEMYILLLIIPSLLRRERGAGD